MKRFSNILVYLPDDCDQASTVERAAALLEPQGRMTLAEVGRIFPPQDRIYGRLDFQNLDTAQRHRRLDRVAQPFVDRGFELDKQVLRGTASEALIDRVERAGHDLVLKPGWPDYNQGLFGTTAMRLFRGCPCSVWVAQPGLPVVPRRIAAAIADPDEEGHEALLTRILDTGRMLAKVFDAPFELVHAYRAFGESLLRAELGQEEIETYLEDVKKGVSIRLKPFVQALPLALVRGPAESEIPAYIQRTSTDLLIVGTVGRKGLKGFFIGNTAERLLRAAPCSILTIRPE